MNDMPKFWNRPEDLPRAMNDREERRGGSGISVLPARYDDDDDDVYVA